MAVEYVKELFEDRAGSDNLERKRSYTRTFEVRTDDAEDDATVAGGTALLPRNGEPHPGDPFAVMVGIDPVQSSQDNTLWKVTCRYSSDLPDAQQREAITYDNFGVPAETPGATSSTGAGGAVTREDDPRDRPAAIEVDTETTTEIVRRDINGTLITNSANYPYDPPPTRERNFPVITITKNLPVDSELLHLGKQAEYQEITNSDTPWGFSEGTLRFVRMRYRGATENDIAYAEFSVSIKVHWEGWALVLADVGFADLDGVWFTDPLTKAQPNDPRPLDGTGYELGAGLTPEPITWEIYRSAPFIPILALLGVTA